MSTPQPSDQADESKRNPHTGMLPIAKGMYDPSTPTTWPHSYSMWYVHQNAIAKGTSAMSMSGESKPMDIPTGPAEGQPENVVFYAEWWFLGLTTAILLLLLGITHYMAWQFGRAHSIREHRETQEPAWLER